MKREVHKFHGKAKLQKFLDELEEDAVIEGFTSIATDPNMVHNNNEFYVLIVARIL